MKWLDTWTGNYILALLIFAVLVELLMLPFGIKQQKNSIKQAKLRPKEMAIRKKYAGRDDKATQQKVAQEIQELYQKENYNQFAGCLPLLIQLPIIMILYYVIINPLHYELRISTDAIEAMRTFITTAVENGGLGLSLGRNAKSTIEMINVLNDSGYWQTISANFANFAVNGTAVGSEAFLQEFQTAVANGLPDLTIFGGAINLGEIPSITQPSWLWSIPVLTFGAYFGSMKLTRKLTYQPTMQTQDMGCSNKVMDVAMPLFSVYITFVVPAAVGVYWIFKSILGTAKQFILYKIFPLPKFTEEDYKAAERELAGKNPQKPKSSGNGPKPGVRSLHHIDDDDYLPPVSKDDKKQTSKRYGDDFEEDKPVTEEKKSSPIEQAPLKEDDRHREESSSQEESPFDSDEKLDEFAETVDDDDPDDNTSDNV